MKTSAMKRLGMRATIAAAIGASVAADAGAQAPAQVPGQRPLPTVLPATAASVTTRIGEVSIAGRGDADEPAVLRVGERELVRSADGMIWIVAAWRYRAVDAVLLAQHCDGSSCTGAFLVTGRSGASVGARLVADARFAVERGMTAQRFTLIPAGIVFPATIDTSGETPRWTRPWFDLAFLRAETSPVTPAEARSLTCRAAFRGVSACAELRCRGDAAFPGAAAPADRLRSYLEARLEAQAPGPQYDQRVIAMLAMQDAFWAACARACAAGSVRASEYRGFEAAACGR